MSDFSTILKKLREEKNLKQIDVANGSNITVRTYQYYESGKQEPNVSRLKKLAIFFDVSMDYLVGLTNNPTPYEKMTSNSIICTTPQYSDAALTIAKKYDEVTPDIQRRIDRYVSGEYEDYCQSSAEKLIEKTGSYS